MDYLRFANWGTFGENPYSPRAAVAPAHPDYEDLGTVLQDPRLRRDIARRPDLARFVRDEAA
jgi:hypothetical protein